MDTSTALLSLLLIWLWFLGVRAAPEQHPLSKATQPETLPLSSESAPPYRDSLLSLHRSLVEIPSVSGTENKVGSFLVEYLSGLGFVAQLQFLPPQPHTPKDAERFNVIAWPGPTLEPKPSVLVSSHIDVVPPYIPYHIDSDYHVGPETKISGRGSVDAKGSVAAQITAVQQLVASKELRGDELMLLFVVGEETTGDGMRFFSDSLDKMDAPPKFKAAVFGEPTENKLACGHKGLSVCTVKAVGKAGHSGYPWLGKSATELLVRALVKMLDTDLGSSERFGNTTVNIGVIEGGVAANVIPKEARCKLVARVAAGDQQTGHDIVTGRIQKILEEVDSEALSLGCHNGYGPVHCDCDVEGKSFPKIHVRPYAHV